MDHFLKTEFVKVLARFGFVSNPAVSANTHEPVNPGRPEECYAALAEFFRNPPKAPPVAKKPAAKPVA